MVAKSAGKAAANGSGKDSGSGRKGDKGRAEKSAAEKSGAERSAGKKPGAEKPAGTKTAGKKPAGKKPGAEKSAGKKSAGKKSSTRKSSTRKSSTRKSSTEHGGRKARPTANTPEIPSTLERSPDAKAARTFVAAHDAAVEQYGRGERARRTALAAVKHSYEKVGDHWEPKDEKGPSDSRAASPRGRSGTSAGGVDTSATRAHLYVLAQRLDIPGRSRMTKEQLVEALQKANDAATARARR